MRLTERDKRIIEAIRSFGAMDSWQIHRLFFPGAGCERVTSRRLVAIVSQSEIQRTVDPWIGRYVYYTKRAQLTHKRLVAEFYVRLVLGPGQVEEFDNHITVGGFRPDAYAAYTVGGMVYLIFLEVQISNNMLDMRKYELLKASGEVGAPFPLVIVVSDRKWRIRSSVRYIVIPTSFEGLEEYFNDRKSAGI